ncbi:MAG: N-acetylmuramoyl-L-alanine amidase [Actinocatenispora sp.]
MAFRQPEINQPEIDRRTLFKATLGAATVAVVGTTVGTAGPAAASSATDFSWIIDCDSWGARPPADPLSVSTNTTNKIIVHHMAFPNVTDYSQEHAKQLARDCQDLHIDGNGWSDTGQHFTVSRGGFVTEGRHGSLEQLEIGEHQMVAAHCPGENGNAIGIENEGTYVTETPPEALLAALTKLCVTVCRQYGLHAYDIFGHWDFRATDCPGIAFYREFPMLRRRVAAGLCESPRQAPARRWPDIWRFVGGPVVQVAQYLLNARGYALTVDGVFGDDTTAAVQDWQARNGIPVDVDATLTTATWETLAPRLDKHASGDAVSAAQFILAHKGYDVQITGGYDHATMKAVQAIQHLHGLTPRGSVDTSTWCAIVGGIVRESLNHH